MALKQKKNGVIRTLAGLKALDGNEIGAIIAFGGNTVPAGYLPCDGSAVSRTIYAGLFAVIGTVWGSGDGSTTFNLPNLTEGRFLEGGTSGTYKDAGLPNITGQVSIFARNKSDSGAYSRIEDKTGAFNVDTGVTGRLYTNADSATSSGVTTESAIGINAHNSNAIYSDDVTTVQPKSATVKYCIRYMRTTTTMLTLAEIKTAMVNMLYPVGSRYVQLAGMPEPSTFGGTWSVDSDYNGKTLWCSTSDELGTALTEELPNIKGWESSSALYGANAHLGAIQEQWTQSHRYTESGGTNIGQGGYTFNAALGQVNADGSTYKAEADSTYKNGGIVRPASMTCKVWLRTA